MSDSAPHRAANANADAPETDRQAPARAGGKTRIGPAIFLDYGTDGTAGDDAACEVCARGMRFRSRWQFDLGAVLNITFSFQDGATARFEAEGLVVECQPDGNGDGGRLHRTTLAFVEVPHDLRAALGKVSARLVFPGERG